MHRSNCSLIRRWSAGEMGAAECNVGLAEGLLGTPVHCERAWPVAGPFDNTANYHEADERCDYGNRF
jgi:hypothetical protein